MKYAAIKAHQAYFPVALMCRALEVGRSGFYAAQRRRASIRCDWRTRAEARLAIFEYLECWYN